MSSRRHLSALLRDPRHGGALLGVQHLSRQVGQVAPRSSDDLPRSRLPTDRDTPRPPISCTRRRGPAGSAPVPKNWAAPMPYRAARSSSGVQRCGGRGQVVADQTIDVVPDDVHSAHSSTLAAVAGARGTVGSTSR
jgi:hypothetical protein